MLMHSRSISSPCKAMDKVSLSSTGGSPQPYCCELMLCASPSRISEQVGNHWLRPLLEDVKRDCQYVTSGAFRVQIQSELSAFFWPNVLVWGMACRASCDVFLI